MLCMKKGLPSLSRSLNDIYYMIWCDLRSKTAWREHDRYITIKSKRNRLIRAKYTSLFFMI